MAFSSVCSGLLLARLAHGDRRFPRLRYRARDRLRGRAAAQLVDRAGALLGAADLRAALRALHARLADVRIDAVDILVVGGRGAGDEQGEDGEMQETYSHGAIPPGWVRWLDVDVDARDPVFGVELEPDRFGDGVAQFV